MPDCKSWLALEGIRAGLTARLAPGTYSGRTFSVSYGPVQNVVLGDLPAVIIVSVASDLTGGPATRHARKMRVLLHVIAEATASQGVLRALLNSVADVEKALAADEQLVTIADEDGQRVTNGVIEFISEALNPELTEFFQKATATIEVMVPLWWSHARV